MDYRINWSILDGKLDYDCGRIVIYKTVGVKSNGPSRDHNDLITALAAKYRISRSEVASNASRYYWRPTQNRNIIIISPVRKIDENWCYDKNELFNKVIDDLFDK